jgi:hypothetical protein
VKKIRHELWDSGKKAIEFTVWTISSRKQMNHKQDHLTETQAEQFRRRRMDAEDRARWERHMTGCHECLALVYGARNSMVRDRLVEALTVHGEEEFHLSMAELRRYASGSMDEADRAIFKSHLEDCPACRSQAGALAPTAPDSPSAMPFPAEPSSIWHRLLRFWQEARFAWPARLALATVLGACLLLGWAAWHRRSSGVDRLEQSTGGDAAMVVRLRDGSKEITLDKKGTLAGIAGLDPAASNAVRDALTNAGLSKPQVLSELSGPAIKFMGQAGSPPPFALISPVDTVVGDEQPTLRWEALRGATSYTVAVFDQQFQPVTRARFRAETEWRVPAPLRRGATYYWQVTARKGGLEITVPAAPAPRAGFKVLDSTTANDLEKARVFTDSHLVLGILYARQGLRLDAERELKSVAEQNPQSPLPAKLLSDVRSW